MRIYLLSSKGISPTSRLIKWRQWGYPYTHIAHIGPKFPDNPHNPVVCEAWWNGYKHNLFSESHTPGTEFSIFSYEVNSYQADAVEDFIYKLLGKKYDYAGLLGFLFFNKSLESKNKWFCSESEFAAAKHAGVRLLRDTDPAEVSPQLFLKSPLLRHEGNYFL